MCLSEGRVSEKTHTEKAIETYLARESHLCEGSLLRVDANHFRYF